MCNSEIDNALQNALNEIKQNMNLRGCGREKKVPPSDPYIEKIITDCDAVFEKLQQKLSEPFSEKTYGKVARTSKKYKIDDAVLLAGINSDYDKNQYELTCEKNSYIFPKFNSRDTHAPVSKILSTSTESGRNLCILRILPYLLTAYYFNLFGTQRIRADISDILSKPADSKQKTPATYSRDVSSSLKMFSYEDFLPELYKCDRVGKIAAKDIADRCTFIRYLFSSISSELSSRLHLIQIYKIFIYSIIATACLEASEEDSKNIDFKLSWKLFDAHTCASATALSIYARFENDANAFEKGTYVDSPIIAALIDLTNREDSIDLMTRTFNSLINRATISCKALQQKDESKQKPLNIRTPNKKSLYTSPIYECSLDIPSQYQIEGDIPPNIDTFKALVYALRFSSSPFHVYDCDYPCIAQDLVKHDKYGFHLPFMVMHSRTRRKNTASNQKS